MNHYRRSKCFFAATITVLGLLLLTGCSGAKSEKEIVADLQASEQFISDTVEISDYEIIKRQTDKESKSDTVYITVQTDEPELICELSYIMQYSLYNEGWILEGVERYFDGPWSIEGLPEEQILSDIYVYDAFIADYEAAHGSLNEASYTIVNEDYNGDIYTKSIDVSYVTSDALIDYYAQYHMVYGIDKGQWVCFSLWLDASHYEPKFSPSIEATDEIMSTLSYDSYSYLRTDQDWENCSETAYYTAEKHYFLGTEIFEVAIPLSFSLESDSSMWKYTSSKITETYLTTSDWHIQGIWSASGNGYKNFSQDTYDIYLEIGEIKTTEDSKVFSVSTLSDSVYHDIAFIELNTYYCITDSYINSNMIRTDSGTYRLEVESVAEGEGVYGSGLTKGTFSIHLGDTSNSHFGIDWTGGGRVIELDSPAKYENN